MLLMKKEQLSCLSYLIRPHKSITFWNRFQALLSGLRESASLPDVPLPPFTECLHLPAWSATAQPVFLPSDSLSPLRLFVFHSLPAVRLLLSPVLRSALPAASSSLLTGLPGRPAILVSLSSLTPSPARHHHTFLSFSLFPTSFLLTNPARGAIIAKRKWGEGAPYSIWVWRSW